MGYCTPATRSLPRPPERARCLSARLGSKDADQPLGHLPNRHALTRFSQPEPKQASGASGTKCLTAVHLVRGK